MRPVIVIGDVHGDFFSLRDCINRHRPSLVLQVGDFGNLHQGFPKKGLPKSGFLVDDDVVPVHFCDGNHENHPALAHRRANGTVELAPGVFYQPRGSTIPLPDGRVILFAGGAASIDKDRRTPGKDWFPEEILTMAEVALFPDISVDIVISHAAPESVALPETLNGSFYDPSREALELVRLKYTPSLWYCGHYHVPFRHQLGACRFTALNQANPNGFSMKLPTGGVAILPQREESA